MRPVAVAALAIVCAASCGDDGGAERKPAALAAVAALQQAFTTGDMERVCARMSVAARRQAASFAHGRRDSCEQDLREALAIAQPGPVRGTRPPPALSGARIDGRRAAVDASAADGGSFDVPLVEERGRWRLDSFFGTPERQGIAAAAAVRRRPFPPVASAEAVEVSDGPDLPCFPLVTDLFPTIEGGCAIYANGPRVRLVIDTPFGRYDFGECEIAYTMRADASGRTWSSEISFNTPGSNNGCADVDPCRSAEGDRLPWKGRIRARGDVLLHDVDACIDSCVGYFAGRLTLRLARRGGRWRADADGAGVGRSGLNLDGQLRLEPAAIRIRAVAG